MTSWTWNPYIHRLPINWRQHENVCPEPESQEPFLIIRQLGKGPWVDSKRDGLEILLTVTVHTGGRWWSWLLLLLLLLLFSNLFLSKFHKNFPAETNILYLSISYSFLFESPLLYYFMQFEDRAFDVLKYNYMMIAKTWY